MDVPEHVLCLNGGRIVNKRMAMFIEGLRTDGIGVRILALPRGPWILDKSEQPTTPDRLCRMTAEVGIQPHSRLASILCFHWSVLPLAAMLGMLWRVPVVYDEHDHYELNTLEGDGSLLRRRLYSVLVRWIHRLFLPLVSLVTCIHLNQQTLKRHLEKWQPSVLEIHNYPSRIWREFPRSAGPQSTLCFVYIGGVYYEKGVGAASEAFLALPESVRRHAELHVFGDGDRQLIAELKQKSGVVVHNGVSPDVFRRFTANHSCCGLSLLANTPRYSLVGTNCTKLYEYLALGMPVIATRVGEFPDFISANQLGLLIDGDLSVTQLSHAMQRLIEDQNLFESCSLNARQLMSRDEMTWEHQWDRIEQTGFVPHRKAA